ncbi:MAG: carbon monoxide dehydrogenase [Rhizobiales bacterium]|nr:carbon monoxide dehydrogenase [Hyphomicrobiales bacterium]
MKPAPFEYVRPGSLAEAQVLLADRAGAKVMAGGQTLGPMLNLRLVQPSLLVDITRIDELTRVEAIDGGRALLIGACVTHAAIEDGLIEDPCQGLLGFVARGIAYRAVRTRGTIGGSLAHGDPAADWLSSLVAADAAVVVHGGSGERRMGLADFMLGAMSTALEEDEMLTGVVVPRLSRGARWGYAKICRKTGEFAHAIGVYLEDRERGIERFVAGATDGRPIVVELGELGAGDAEGLRQGDRGAIKAVLTGRGLARDDYELALNAAAIARALDMARRA